MKTEREVESWLAGQLGHPISAPLWKTLKRNGTVEAVLIGTDPDARADLIRDAKWHEQTLREASRGSRPKATGKARTAESPKDTSAYRAQAVGEYLALVAGQLPSVRRFRARALRGALVGLDHEANFLNSPAIRLLNRAGFSGELLT